MKKLSYLFILLAILLSDVMCAFVAYSYRGMLCVTYSSAPASVSFLLAIPFAAAIIVCIILAYLFHRKAK